MAQGLKRAGGCAVGLHLRGKRHQAAEAGRFHWRVDDVWPRLRDEVQKRKGGLFVAADGHLALLRNALESRAWEDGIAVLTSAQIKFHGVSRHRRDACSNAQVVTADDLGQGQRGGAMTALAENHILSKCSLIVPTDPSSFLGIAAQRAAAADDSVRAAMACPATSPMASPFSATGDPCPCFFATQCPSNFSRQLVHYGFAPDTGRASKHHSYEDHGSKPECPGLHDE